MAYKLRLKFDGSCPTHARYSPEKGMPLSENGKVCAGCEDLYTIHLYARIVKTKIDHARIVKKGDTYTVDKPEETKPVEVIKPEEVKPEVKLEEIKPVVIEAPMKRKRGRPRKVA